MTLQAGMMIVVQPNVITRDQRAGVQVGELVLVTADGYERLHAAPSGFIRVG
jgi:Xaa-Pro aminopeptidase